MKKITAILLAALMLFALAACGSTEENNPEKSNEAIKILNTAYAEYCEGQKSAKYIRDFDGDGTEDMIICNYKELENKFIERLDIHYVKLNGENAEVVVTYSFEGEWKDFPHGEAEHTELYINENSQLLLNILSKWDGIQGNFILLEIGENQITEEKHLFDPGYSSGLGLFYYDNYFNHYDETEPLYDYEAVVEISKGIYPSYKEALEAELGIYGFSWKLSEMSDINDLISEKYVVDPTEKVELIFENYNFEGIDIEEYYSQVYA